MNSPEAISRVHSYLGEHTDELIALTADLVRTPSVSPNWGGFDPAEVLGGETSCNERLRPVYEAAGCAVEVWEEQPGRANLVGVHRGAGGGRSLLFNGHVDTAPPGAAEAWSHGGPFSGSLEDGRIFGRGSCDMKAGLAAQAFAALAISRVGIDLCGDLILESVVGEESMDHEAGTSAAVRRGYRADAAVVGEPTSVESALTIAPASAGAMSLRITFSGRSNHAMARGSVVWPTGQPEPSGVSAIEKALLVADALRRLEQEWAWTKTHPLFPPGHFTIGLNVISGHPVGMSMPYAVPDHCELGYEVVLHPSDSPGQVRREVEACVGRACDQDRWLRQCPPTIDWLHAWPSYDTPTDSAICETLRTACMTVLGEEAAVRGFRAVDDATFLSDAGIPSITFGPGDLAQAHAVNESVAVSEIVDACRVYATLAILWSGVREDAPQPGS